MINWHDMFVISFPLFLEKMIRPIIVYAFLVVGLRLAGKRELAQLNPFDLVVLLTLSNTVQNAIIGNDNTLTGGLVGAATLLVINHVLVEYLHRHRRIEEIVEGKRDWLIKHGRVQAGHLDKELMTRAELTAAAHRQGIASLSDVDSAILEPTGTLTFTTKTPTDDDRRHHELLDVIERLRSELAELKPAKHLKH